jgi:hypothetical protein
MQCDSAEAGAARAIPHAGRATAVTGLSDALEHGFRFASDPILRYLVFHKPFWHDYAGLGGQLQYESAGETATTFW